MIQSSCSASVVHTGAATSVSPSGKDSCHCVRGLPSSPRGQFLPSYPVTLCHTCTSSEHTARGPEGVVGWGLSGSSSHVLPALCAPSLAWVRTQQKKPVPVARPEGNTGPQVSGRREVQGEEGK